MVPSAKMTVEDPRSTHVCTDGCERFGLSYTQRAIWLTERLRPGTRANRLSYGFRLQYALDVDAFLVAVQRVVDRHGMLRATCEEIDGAPVQIVHTRAMADAVAETVPDCSEEPLAERLSEEAAQPFDLQRGPLIRFRVFTRSTEEHVLLISAHHLVSDMWSLALIGHELVALYWREIGAGGELPAVPGRYDDFVRREDRLVSSDAGARHLAFWMDELAGATLALGPRTDHRRVAGSSDPGATRSVTLGAATTASLRDLAKSTSTTLRDVVLAAFQALLHRYTGSDDVVVGCMKANRSVRNAKVVGCFINPVAIRTDFSDDPSLRVLLRRVHGKVEASAPHAGYPFVRILDELRVVEPMRASGEGFRAMFSWQRTTRLIDRDLVVSSAMGIRGAGASIAGLPVEPIPITERGAPFDISLLAGEIGSELVLTFEYNTDLFDSLTIERFVAHYWAILEAGVVDPGCRVGELPLLSEGERADLEVWAGSVGDGAGGAVVPVLVERRVVVAGDAVAVRFGGAWLSFTGVNARANQLARHLVGLGVGRGDVVGVWLDRSLEMVVAVLAVMKAGAAFVPLDPAFPADRLGYMVADSGARVVVTGSALSAGGGLGAGVEYVCVDADAAVIAGYLDGDLGVGVGASDLAYVMYTSGSTGRPKGVQVEHGSLANLLTAMARRPGLAAGDVLLAVTTLSFDIALLELLLPLVVGAEVVVVGRETAADGGALAVALVGSGATVMQATPSTWRMLVEAGWAGGRGLKALCGGEAMSRDLADALLARCGSVWNMYGPTETTVWSAVAEVVSGDGPVPIGVPVDNTRLYVLDGRRQLVPVGVPGELWIGGAGVARGYLGRPELTAERFVADPFRSVPGARMYRTGDLVRRLAGGEIEFLGRVDAQLKVRGHRIEPGEIEAVLVEHPGVSQAVVVAHEHGPGDVRLAAYIVAVDPALPPSPGELRAHLRSKLPDYMVPAAYVPLDALPTTPNNKVDRTRLPAPPASPTPGPGSNAPLPGLEAEIARIWEQVLGVQGIGRDDDFFDLGGHSLLAIRVFAQVEALTGRRPPLSTLFRAPTIASFAEVVEADDVQRAWTSLVPVHTGGARPPFFYVSPFLITALSFSALGRHLGPDQPFYVIQPQGMEHDCPVHTSVEEMAAHYITEMREAQPTGPYWLGGHCAGCAVAFEMTRQLQASGEEVAVLVLVDGDPPGITPSEKPHGPTSMARRIWWYWRDGRLIEAVRWKLSVGVERIIVRRFGQARDRRRIAELRATHARAHAAYTGGTARGDALVVRSAEVARDRAKDWQSEWAKLFTGRLHASVVPGTHAGLSRDPSAAAIARTIRSAMDAALTSRSTIPRPSSAVARGNVARTHL